MGRQDRSETVIGGEKILEGPDGSTLGIGPDNRVWWRYRRMERKGRRYRGGRGERRGYSAAFGLEARTAPRKTRGGERKKTANADGPSVESRSTREREDD